MEFPGHYWFIFKCDASVDGSPYKITKLCIRADSTKRKDLYILREKEQDSTFKFYDMTISCVNANDVVVLKDTVGRKELKVEIRQWLTTSG